MYLGTTVADLDRIEGEVIAAIRSLSQEDREKVKHLFTSNSRPLMGQDLGPILGMDPQECEKWCLAFNTAGYMYEYCAPGIVDQAKPHIDSLVRLFRIPEPELVAWLIPRKKIGHTPGHGSRRKEIWDIVVYGK